MDDREKERSKAAENYGNTKYSDGINSLICAEDFLAGAKWADQHPREGLWDANKVIEWLKDNSSRYIVCDESDFSHYAYNSLIEDLRKAMEE